jgi:hypothetical protein
MTEHEEEYEGVTLYVDTEGWPSELFGLVIKAQTVYPDGGKLKIIGDPIWKGISSND